MTQDAGAVEVNVDGLVGPTHNYAGLARGNLAATGNALAMSNPRAAALEGIAKMRSLIELGLMQAVLPPPQRPHLPTLRRWGFSGSDRAVVEQAARQAPMLLRLASSASAMWTANAATVTPSADSADGRVHITPANLASMPHRAIEAETTTALLKAIFPEGPHFTHHPALAPGSLMSDEGAANHNRFCRSHGEPGVALFVYGREGGIGESLKALRYPARQTRLASQAIARTHGLNPARTVFVRQSDAAINAGAFHNDVVAVAHRDVFFYHADAFDDPRRLSQALSEAAGFPLHFIEVPAAQVSLDDAVKSYLFNAQLLSLPGHNGMTLLVPSEAAEMPSTAAYLDTLSGGDGPIDRISVHNVRQSMQNGGGPACLRLRMVLTAAERAAMHQGVIMTPARLDQLEGWVRTHYRDRLSPDDLGDPALLDESRQALEALGRVLGLAIPIA